MTLAVPVAQPLCKHNNHIYRARRTIERQWYTHLHECYIEEECKLQVSEGILLAKPLEVSACNP